MLALIAYALWARSYDLVLPLPVCMPLFDLHQAVADAPETSSASRALWIAINLPCGDF